MIVEVIAACNESSLFVICRSYGCTTIKLVLLQLLLTRFNKPLILTSGSKFVETIVNFLQF